MMPRLMRLMISALFALALPGILPGPMGGVEAAEKVTTHPALEYAGSPSADGRFLAFVSEQNGNADIWLKSLTAGVSSLPRALTHHPGKDTAPSLNANGSSLLYVSYRSDPRGDIYLLDVPTGKETRLTDERSGDLAPVWGGGDTAYFLREDEATGRRSLARLSLATGNLVQMIEHAVSFTVGATGTIVYSDGRKLLALTPSSPTNPQPLTTGEFLDASPSFVDANTVVFTRYQDDTNGDGAIDADDESSLYLGRWDFTTGERKAFYRLTPGGEFHGYPAAAGPYVYYSDLKRKDLYRLHLPEFFETYADVPRARDSAAILLDRGETEPALLILGNLSANLASQLSLTERAEFDLALVELLRDARRHAAAKELLARYASSEGRAGARARLALSVVRVEERAAFMSPRAIKKAVEELSKELLAAARNGQDDTIRASAFLETGRAHLLADDPLTALTFLTKVDETANKELRALGLLTRADVYRHIGEQEKVLRVFLDVIMAFGEQSPWGRRAVARAVAIADRSDDARKAVASLTELAERHRTLPHLAGSALLRAAERYDEMGERQRAVEMLDRIVLEFPSQATLTADAYRKKGAMLAAAQRYDEAAKAYAALVDLTGRSREELEQARGLMILHSVRSAIRKREFGEVRIAAKDLRGLIDAYPDSVEAHRGYIETKVMLGEIDEVRRFYEALTKNAPDNPSYRYGLGLTLSYSAKPDIDLVIKTIEDAARLNPKVSYFHQTLGWAYEQAERLGKSGALEHAEREFRVALELNDAFLFPDVENNLLLNLGNTYMGLGNYAEAHRHYARRTVADAPERDSLRELLYRKNYGEASFKTGRTEESIVQYERALALVPTDKEELRAELLERIGLSHQDAGRHARAVEYFSEALALNSRLGSTENLARLRRNVGLNLYNMGATAADTSHESLKRGLKSLLGSLEMLDRFGVTEKPTGPGLLQVQVALGAGGAGAASGFDRRGEEKLLFTYIARTYEELSEPAPAKEYYEKKLALIKADGTSPQAIAARTEEAVVLNRLGVLSHSLGRTEESIRYLERSLARTRELGLDYGTKVNLYNLSRLAVERRTAGGLVEPRLAETVADGLRTILRETKPDRMTLTLLANAAFLLAGWEEASDIAGRPLEAVAEEIHRVHRARQDAVSFLRTALDLVEDNTVLSGEAAGQMRLMLKLNLMDLAEEAGRSSDLDRLQSEVANLVKEQPSALAWLPPFFQAQRSVQPETRTALLKESVETLLRLPPPAFPAPVGLGNLPLLDALSALTTDLLAEQGQAEAAFAASERVAMRKVAVLLHDKFGPDFFLSNIGDYAADLGGMMRHMRAAIREGRTQDLEGLVSQFHDLIFALYEEYPWAVSYLHQYDPSPPVLSEVLRADTPYLKVMPGRRGLHVFLHQGEAVRHFHLPQSSGRPPSLDGATLPVRDATVVYLSAPPDVRPLVVSLLPKNAAIVEVATVYDVLNAYRLRTLFATRAAVAGKLSLAGEGTAPQDPVTRLTGERDRDARLLEGRNVFVAVAPYEGTGFVIGSELGVRNKVPLAALSGKNRHTAVLLDPNLDRETIRLTMVPALIRAGFPHIIVASGLPPSNGGAFVESYLKLIEGQRPDRAADAAAQTTGGGPDRIGTVQLYGYVGMNQDEKASFADSAYRRAVSDAVAAYQSKQYETALRRSEDALSILRFTKAGQDFPKLTDLAVDTAFKIGDYRTAVLHQSKLVKHIDNSGDWKARAEALYRLGILYSRLEEFEPALTHLESAIELWRKQDELDRLAEGIATLGVVKENMGAYTEALDAFGQSFEVYQELGEAQDMATQHRRIARIEYLRLGRYERARDRLMAALNIYRNQDVRRAEAEILYEIGLTYEKTGLYDEADRHYTEGRRIGTELRDPHLLATGSLYLANTSWFRGRYQEAFDHLEAATGEAEHSDDPQLPIMIANTRALLYWTLNDLEKALVYAEQAVARAEAAGIKEEIASSHNNLGLMQRDRGKVERSLEHFDRAKQIDEQLNSRWGLGYDHRNIGISLMKLGRHADARMNFESAERYSAAIKNVDNWVKALLELGHVHRETGGHGTAIDYYQRAYELSKRHHMKEVLWRAAAGHGAVLRLTGRKSEAVAHYREAVDIVESMRAALKIEEFRNSFQTKTQDLYRDMIILLIELGRTGEAFNYLERSRSRSFIDLLANQKLAIKTETDQQMLDLVTTLQAQLDVSSRELASFEQPPPDLVSRVRKAKAAYDEALVRLKRSSPELSSFVAVDPLTQEQVQKLLEPDVGLLSYKVTENHVYLWLVTASGTRFYQVPTALGEVEQLIRSYRLRVQRLESVSEELERLSKLLLAPVFTDLEGLRYLGIIPDGPLHFLSFAALSGGAGALIDTHLLFYAPSASVLKFTFAKRSEVKLTKVLAIGNPDLGNYNYQLPLAELEARSIRWDFPNLDILTGAKATKEWVLANISRYGIIHMATHGEFDDLNPLLSSLWLASPNPDNRRLTVREVFGLNLKADLVTLSACQTGLGKLEAGELIGLNRAFLYAGTHTLVSALWRVDDLATSVLMKHFYRHYAGMDKAASLRQAQLLVKKDFPHPAYWSGLALVGDYR